jgi:uncharacterized sodium:solute symporter family permease YidK
MTTETNTSHPKKEFNYCFWAKLLVAIPAIPLVAMIAASFFSGMVMQIAAGITAIALMIYAAIKIDQVPCLLRKVMPKE